VPKEKGGLKKVSGISARCSFMCAPKGQKTSIVPYLGTGRKMKFREAQGGKTLVIKLPGRIGGASGVSLSRRSPNSRRDGGPRRQVISCGVFPFSIRGHTEYRQEFCIFKRAAGDVGKGPCTGQGKARPQQGNCPRLGNDSYRESYFIGCQYCFQRS